ncbi:hypothetical protein Pst134EB_007905 [Puccinia striiformis f. sp. tritici]|nr:hypothetical protein Pst134EB_007905 [Puccinia striiformis f. sp. tritici]
MSVRSEESQTQKTIVVIGLAGAGLKTFNLLLDKLTATTQNIRIIAIEKSNYAYWAPGSLRAAVLNGFEDKILRGFEHIVPTKMQDNERVLTFIGTEVLELDLENRFLVTDKSLDGLGTKLAFDYLVVASGSSYAFPCRPPPEAEGKDDVKNQLRTLQSAIQESKSIVIVGGGVVGIELAGEISYQYPSKSVTLICSSPTLLPDMNPKLGCSLKQQLEDRKVNIIFGVRADLDEHHITKTGKLDKLTVIGLAPKDGGDREEVEADFVFLATGNKPNSKFIPPEYLNPANKLVKVNKHLQVTDSNEKPIEGVYGVGDVIDFNESKLYAALDGQASTVTKNLWIDITNSSDKKVVHQPIKDTISIPLGPCGGITEVYGFTCGLGSWSTSLVKGWSLLVWMFNSMYPEKESMM